MAQDPSEVGAKRLEDDQDKSADQLRAEIEDTREEHLELAVTAFDRLADKAMEWVSGR